MTDRIVELRADCVGADDVNQQIRSIWSQLLRDPEFVKEAERMGLDSAILVKGSPLFEAQRTEGQIGVAETILIALASGAASEAGKIALRNIWERAIWPRLSRHFGAGLELSSNDPTA